MENQEQFLKSGRGQFIQSDCSFKMISGLLVWHFNWASAQGQTQVQFGGQSWSMMSWFWVMIVGTEKWTHLRVMCALMWTEFRSGGNIEDEDKESGKDDASFMLCGLWPWLLPWDLGAVIPHLPSYWFSTLETQYNYLNIDIQIPFPEILVYLVGVRSGHWCFSQSPGGDFRMPPRFHQGWNPVL